MIRPMTPTLIAIVLGAGLLALVPTRRVAERTDHRWAVAAWWLGLWLLLIAIVVVPPLRRIAVPVAIVLAVAPWLNLPDAVTRFLGVSRRRPPPRNVTPPEAGGPSAP